MTIDCWCCGKVTVKDGSAAVWHYLRPPASHVLNALEATSPRDAEDVLWRAEQYAAALGRA